MRIFKGSIIFLLIGVCCIGFSYFYNLFPYENHNEYESFQTGVSKIRVERYEGRRGVPYYERAIYTQDGSRFFNRAPAVKDLVSLNRPLRSGDLVRVYHLKNSEVGRGFRIAHLTKDEDVIIDLKELRSVQYEKNQLLVRFGIVFLAVGGAFFAYSRRSWA